MLDLRTVSKQGANKSHTRVPTHPLQQNGLLNFYRSFLLWCAQTGTQVPFAIPESVLFVNNQTAGWFRMDDEGRLLYRKTFPQKMRMRMNDETGEFEEDWDATYEAEDEHPVGTVAEWDGRNEDEEDEEEEEEDEEEEEYEDDEFMAEDRRRRKKDFKPISQEELLYRSQMGLLHRRFSQPDPQLEACDIIAVFIQDDTSRKKKSERAGQKGIQLDFCDNAKLKRVLDRHKPDGVLQKYIVPEGGYHAMLQAIWTPYLQVVEKRRNTYPVTEQQVSLYHRTVTSSMVERTLTEDVPIRTMTEHQIEQYCKFISAVIKQKDHMATNRMVLYMTAGADNALYLLWTSAFEIIPDVDPHPHYTHKLRSQVTRMQQLLNYGKPFSTVANKEAGDVEEEQRRQRLEEAAKRRARQNQFKEVQRQRRIQQQQQQQQTNDATIFAADGDDTEYAAHNKTDSEVVAAHHHPPISKGKQVGRTAVTPPPPATKLLPILKSSMKMRPHTVLGVVSRPKKQKMMRKTRELQLVKIRRMEGGWNKSVDVSCRLFEDIELDNSPAVFYDDDSLQQRSTTPTRTPSRKSDNRVLVYYSENSKNKGSKIVSADGNGTVAATSPSTASRITPPPSPPRPLLETPVECVGGKSNYNKEATRAELFQQLMGIIVRLQTWWRCVLATRELEHRVVNYHAAVEVQRIWRGHRARKKYPIMKNQQQRRMVGQQHKRSTTTTTVSNNNRGSLPTSPAVVGTPGTPNYKLTKDELHQNDKSTDESVVRTGSMTSSTTNTNTTDASLDTAATKIQAGYRGCKARRETRDLKRMFIDKTIAAQNIQRCWRGYIARRKTARDKKEKEHKMWLQKQKRQGHGDSVVRPVRPNFQLTISETLRNKKGNKKKTHLMDILFPQQPAAKQKKKPDVAPPTATATPPQITSLQQVVELKKKEKEAKEQARKTRTMMKKLAVAREQWEQQSKMRSQYVAIEAKYNNQIAIDFIEDIIYRAYSHSLFHEDDPFTFSVPPEYGPLRIELDAMLRGFAVERDTDREAMEEQERKWKKEKMEAAKAAKLAKRDTSNGSLLHLKSPVGSLQGSLSSFRKAANSSIHFKSGESECSESESTAHPPTDETGGKEATLTTTDDTTAALNNEIDGDVVEEEDDEEEEEEEEDGDSTSEELNALEADEFKTDNPFVDPNDATTFHYIIRNHKVVLAQLTSQLERFRSFVNHIFSDQDTALLQRLKDGVESDNMSFYEVIMLIKREKEEEEETKRRLERQIENERKRILQYNTGQIRMGGAGCTAAFKILSMPHEEEVTAAELKNFDPEEANALLDAHTAEQQRLKEAREVSKRQSQSVH